MFGKGFLSKADAAEDETEVNLNVTPMIDVLTTLLFFLLLSFGAVIVALINASVPALSEGTDAPEITKTKVTMTLTITDKGFFVTGSNDALTDDELNKLKKSIPLGKDGYDYQGLNDFLLDTKQRYKDSDSIVIIPDAEIPYEVLVKSMDFSREKETVVDGKPVRTPLFPAPVISTLVK
jgi:biopolymer transport protein ExbD